MKSRTYFQSEMDHAECFRIAGGSICVVSFRCPGKETPNEDAAALIPVGDSVAVLALADGMGGASAGQHAARIAVQSLVESVERVSGDGSLLRSAILNGFEQANSAILELGVGAATTLAVVEIQGNEIRPYHAGDSEILVVGGRGKVKLQTVSHSPVAYAVEAGVLDQDEAMHHEQRHVISNAVGLADMRIEIGSPIRLAPRDTLLMSSDGLTDNLRVDEIIEVIRKGPLSAGVRKLADDAMRRMATPVEGVPSKPDDTTVVTFRTWRVPR